VARARSSLLVAAALEVVNRAVTGEPGGPAGASTEEMEDLLGQLREVRRHDPSPLVALVAEVLTMFAVGQPWSQDALPPPEPPDLAAADPWVQALYDLVRGFAAENLGHIALMAESALRAERFFRAAGESWGLSGALRLRGQAQVYAADLPAAATSFADAADLVARFEAVDDEVQLRMRLVDVLIRLGRDDEVGAQMARMRRLAPLAAAQTRTWLAVVEVSAARREGRHDDARALAARQSEVLARRPASAIFDHERAVVEATVAHVHLDGGEVEEAGEVLQGAWATARGTGDMPVLAAAAIVVARWCAAAGDPVRAAEVLGAVAVVRGADDPGEPEVLRLRGFLLRELGEDGFARAFGRGASLDRPSAIELATPAPVASSAVARGA